MAIPAGSVLPESIAGGIQRARDIPSRTWEIDFGTETKPGHLLSRMIDERQAVHQAATIILLTQRFQTLTHSTQFGAEMDNIIAWDNASTELIRSEIERTTREALLHDERILGVGAIDITFEGENAYIRVEISTIYGQDVVEVMAGV